MQPSKRTWNVFGTFCNFFNDQRNQFEQRHRQIVQYLQYSDFCFAVEGTIRLCFLLKNRINVLFYKKRNLLSADEISPLRVSNARI